MVWYAVSDSSKASILLPDCHHSGTCCCCVCSSLLNVLFVTPNFNQHSQSWTEHPATLRIYRTSRDGVHNMHMVALLLHFQQVEDTTVGQQQIRPSVARMLRCNVQQQGTSNTDQMPAKVQTHTAGNQQLRLSAAGRTL